MNADPSGPIALSFVIVIVMIGGSGIAIVRAIEKARDEILAKLDTQDTETK